ncbi:MAG: hypothetical protein IPH18_18250 [Chitinophagaceae bacterium]|nr:hypothetical protein [Chitinophagaceae bacterium]
MKFAEWVAYLMYDYDVWVLKYTDQRNKDNWKDTGELWKFWWKISANGWRYEIEKRIASDELSANTEV